MELVEDVEGHDVVTWIVWDRDRFVRQLGSRRLGDTADANFIASISIGPMPRRMNAQLYSSLQAASFSGLGSPIYLVLL